MNALTKFYDEQMEIISGMKSALETQLAFVKELEQRLENGKFFDPATPSSSDLPPTKIHKKYKKHEETNDCKTIKYAMQKHKPMKIAMVVEKVKENGIEIGTKTVSNYLDHKHCFIRTGWGTYRLRKNTKKIKRSEINIG